jgi:NADH-quinone oxidoreductase subunit I
VRACPDQCITLDVTTNEDKTKTIDSYVWEMGACMFCGLCEESCPFDALKMGHDYELATWDRTGLYRTLIAGEPAARPKRRSEAADAPTAPSTSAEPAVAAPSADAPATETAEGGEPA